MSNDLRERISRLDPMPPEVPVDPVTSSSSRRLLEEIMDTRIEEPAPTKSGGRRVWVAALAGAAVAVLAIGGLVGVLDGAPEEPPLALSLGADPGTSLGLCIAFSVDILRDMPLAFEGAVVAVEGDRVLMDVVHWYKGGEAAQVELQAPAGLVALIGGIEFVEGGQYLITATEGTVNYCGFSDVATPELREAFEQAFGG